VQIGLFDITAFENGALRITFEHGGDKRVLGLRGSGKELRRVPDDFPDDMDYCALIAAMGSPSLPQRCRQTAHRYLAYVAQRLNPQPMAELLQYVAMRRDLLPDDLIARLRQTLDRVDPEGSRYLEAMASQLGLLDDDES